MRASRARAAVVSFLRGVGARCGLKEQKNIRILVVPPPADLFVTNTIGKGRLKQAHRQAVAVGGRMVRRFRRSG